MNQPVTRAVLTSLVLLAVGLAGCLGGSGQTPAEDAAPENTSENITADNVNNYTNNSSVNVDEDTKFDPSSDLHAHDYWNGRVEKTIIDERTVKIDWGKWTAQCAQTASCHQVPTFVVDVPISESGTPNFVYPGTGSLNVTLSWKSQGLEDTVSSLRPKVCVSNRGYVPNCQESDLSTNATHVYKSSGATWEIKDDGVVNRHTADPPHAMKSNWRFLVQPCDDRFSTGFCFPQGIPNVGMSQFTLTVTIHKAPGDLPVDPPHFAFYDEGETKLTILDGFVVSDGNAKFTHSQWMARQTQGNNRVVWYVGSAQIAHAQTTGKSEQPVVPAGTRNLEVKLTWSSDTETQLGLGYRTAADNWKAPWREPPTAGSCGSGCMSYSIPVTTEQADSPYALQTQWEFGIFHVGDQPRPMTNYEVQLSILAHREAV